MTSPSELDNATRNGQEINGATATAPEAMAAIPELDPDDQLVDDVEMSLFDHLEELRQRIFYGLIAIAVATVACFFKVNLLVKLLERPAQGANFLQLSPGEYFFVSLKVSAYSGILLASPFIIYQIMQFVLPGLTRRERRTLVPLSSGPPCYLLRGSCLPILS